MEQQFESEEFSVRENEEAPATPLPVEAEQDEPQAADDDWED